MPNELVARQGHQEGTMRKLLRFQPCAVDTCCSGSPAIRVLLLFRDPQYLCGRKPANLCGFNGVLSQPGRKSHAYTSLRCVFRFQRSAVVVQ